LYRFADASQGVALGWNRARRWRYLFCLTSLTSPTRPPCLTVSDMIARNCRLRRTASLSWCGGRSASVQATAQTLELPNFRTSPALHRSIAAFGRDGFALSRFSRLKKHLPFASIRVHSRSHCTLLRSITAASRDGVAPPVLARLCGNFPGTRPRRPPSRLVNDSIATAYCHCLLPLPTATPRLPFPRLCASVRDSLLPAYCHCLCLRPTVFLSS
jgi:hypothetical protein